MNHRTKSQRPAALVPGVAAGHVLGRPVVDRVYEDPRKQFAHVLASLAYRYLTCGDRAIETGPRGAS